MTHKGKGQHFATLTITAWQRQCPFVVGILMLSLSILFPSISFIKDVKASGDDREFQLTPQVVTPQAVSTQAEQPEEAEIIIPPEIDDTQGQDDKMPVLVCLNMDSPRGGKLSDVLPPNEERVARVQQSFKAQFTRSIQSKQDELDAFPDAPSLSTPEIKMFSRVPCVAMEVNLVTLGLVLDIDDVKSMEKDNFAWPTLASSVPLIGGELVWDDWGYTGEGQAVAVLDTGVDKTHPALENHVIEEACFSKTMTTSSYTTSSVCPNGKTEQIGNGAGVPCDSSMKGCDHGTHVAGIVAANSASLKGVAKGANIIAVQVFSKFKKGKYCPKNEGCPLSFTSDQLRALEYVYGLHKKGVKIAAVNMSLGSGKNTTVCSSGAIGYIIQMLRDVGIAVIASSGNNGYKNAISSPACISSIVSVGATNGLDKIPNYSNHAYFLDLLAPGSVIKSSVPGGGTELKQGTSMAAPHVAGAWALLKSAVPTATVNDILRCLKNNGKLIIDSTRDNKPRIQVNDAMECLAPQELKPQDIRVTPKSHDFGNVNIGDSSIQNIFKISNGGDSDLNIEEAWITGPEFVFDKDNCSDTSLIPDDDCEIVVFFEPNSEGVKKATLSIPSDDSDTSTFKVSLSGNGIAQTPNIVISQKYFNFGEVNIDETSKEETVTIKNVGDNDLQLGKFSLYNSTEYLINDTSCSQKIVVPEENCSMTVIFKPQLEGNRKGKLYIRSNDPDAPIVKVRLQGTGKNIPTVISLSPTDNATDVAVGTNLVLTFSQPVEANAGNIVIHKTSDNRVVESIDVTSGQVTELGTDTITINPSSNFAHNTEHYVRIDDKAFIGTDGNPYPGISDSTEWTFTTITASADSTPPIFKRHYPKVLGVNYNSLSLYFKTNENGNAYYVVLPEGAEQPMAQQVKKGKDSTGKLVDLSGQKTLKANRTVKAKIRRLKASTAYSIFAVAEDEAANLNTVARVDAKTTFGALTLRAKPTSFSEDAGVSASQGTVYRVGGSRTEALTVKLTSNDTSEANVPPTVTIPSGKKSVTFAIEAVDDSENDGSKRVILRASATDYRSASRRITVLDNENSSASAIAESSIPASMDAGYPIATAISNEQFTLYAKMKERGTAYYVVLANGVIQPTTQQIKLGQDSGGKVALSGEISLSANIQKGARISGLIPSTTYDVFVVPENAANLMGVVKAIEVTTTSGSSSRRAGDRSNDDTGKERFYVMNHRICDFFYELDAETGEMTPVDETCEEQSLCDEIIEGMTWDDNAQELHVSLGQNQVFVYTQALEEMGDTQALNKEVVALDEQIKTMEMTYGDLLDTISEYCDPRQ